MTDKNKCVSGISYLQLNANLVNSNQLFTGVSFSFTLPCIMALGSHSAYHITDTQIICCFEEMPYMTWDLEDPSFLMNIHNVSSHCVTPQCVLKASGVMELCDNSFVYHAGVCDKSKNIWVCVWKWKFENGIHSTCVTGFHSGDRFNNEFSIVFKFDGKVIFYNSVLGKDIDIDFT